MAEIILQKATIGNIPELLAIEEKLTNLKTYSAGTEAKDWENELNKKTATVYLVLKDKNIVGDVSYDKKSDELVEITGFAIDPKFQKQGIGKQVLTIIFEELKNIKTIKLVTHPENSVAIKIYLSFGFIIKGWNDNYYGDGQPRIIMVKENL
ncbi:MAG: N-acetyltransferase [Candidatus Staskawiczbacteria bacterium]|nr:N-acetyltransferase [Candidatus Staskawiczbacteria bacterium]